MAGSTWMSPDEYYSGFDLEDYMTTHAGRQTALNVANISGDIALSKFLLSKGADPSIQPVHMDLIEEFPYRGEFWAVNGEEQSSSK